MPVTSRILKALGPVDMADPHLNHKLLAKAMNDMGHEVVDAFIKQFILYQERQAHYVGRWDYPSGNYCPKLKAYQKHAKDYPGVPKDRRFLMVAFYGNLIEAVIRCLAIGSGVKLIGNQYSVDTKVGHGYLDDVVKLHEEGADNFELDLIRQGYKVLPLEIKSSESRGFNEFCKKDEETQKPLPLSDTFGYRSQQVACLDAFWENSPLVDDEQRKLPPLTAYVYVNKVNGAFAERTLPHDVPLLDQRAKEYELIKLCKSPDEIERPFVPETVYGLKRDGHPVKGNRLQVPCGYCSHKFHCWGKLNESSGVGRNGPYRIYWVMDDNKIYNDPKIRGKKATA